MFPLPRVSLILVTFYCCSCVHSCSCLCSVSYVALCFCHLCMQLRSFITPTKCPIHCSEINTLYCPKCLSMDPSHYTPASRDRKESSKTGLSRHYAPFNPASRPAPSWGFIPWGPRPFGPQHRWSPAPSWGFIPWGPRPFGPQHRWSPAPSWGFIPWVPGPFEPQRRWSPAG